MRTRKAEATVIGEQLSAEELVGELAPSDPLVYRDDSAGYQMADFGFREIQHSTRNPDRVYQLDEFVTLPLA